MRLLRDEQREDERQGRGCDPEDDRRVEGVEDDDVLPGLRLQTPRMERHHGEILPGVGLQVERRSQHRIVVVGAVDDERTVFVGRNGEKRLAVELDLARRLPESRVHGERRLGIHADLRPVGQHDVEPLAARRAVFQGLCGADLRPGPGFGRDIGGALPEPHGANARRNHGGRRHIAQEPTPAPSGDLGDSEQDLVAGCETRPFPLRLGRRGQLPSGETLPEISPVFIRLLQPSRQHTGLLLTQSVAPVRIDQSVYLFLHIIYTKQIFSLCLHPVDTPFPDTDPRRAIFFFGASLSAPPETGNPRAEAPGIFPLPANGQGAAEAAAARSGSRENWVLCEICRILPKIGNHDTATAIHTVQITLGQGLGRSMGALRSLLPRLRTLGRHGLRPRFRRPAFRGRRHLARRRVHRHPLPLERRGLPLRRAPGRLAPPAGTEHGFKSPRGLLPRAARHSGDRPAGG